MNNSKMTNRIQPKDSALRLSLPAMIILCIYLAASTLKYMESFPESLVTLTLYGFIAAGMICFAVNNKIRLYSHTVWCAMFVLVCGISCLYAASSARALSATVSMVKVLVFGLVLANIVNSEQRMKEAMAACSIAAVVLFIYLASAGKLEMEEGERLGHELTGNANIFASLFMIAGMCSVYFTFFSEKKLFRILFLLCFITQLLALAMSGGRKFFLVPIILMAGMQLVRTDKKGRKHLIRNLVVVGVVLAALWWALFNVDFLYESIGYRMEGLVASVTGEGNVDASTKERNAMAKKGIELWGESPLWGHGINAFSVLTYWGVYSHNNYVELLCDLGIIGLFVYYAFYVYLLYTLFKARVPKLKKNFWILVVLGFMIYDYGAVSYNSFMQHMLLVFAMQVAGGAMAQNPVDGDPGNGKVAAL